MKPILVTTHVEAPPAAVFAYVSDLRRAPERISAIQRVEVLTDGPVRKGTRFRETRVLFKREATEEMEILAFEPPESYTLGCESCGCRYRSEFRFTPQGQGTLISRSFAATPLTFFAKLCSFLMAPMMKQCAKACEKDLADLKVAFERDQARAG